MNQKIKLLLLSVGFTLLTPLDSFAQTRPALHWSTFDKNASPCACHLLALSALRQERMQVFEDTGMIILAGNNMAAAEVVCLPGNRQIRLLILVPEKLTINILLILFALVPYKIFCKLLMTFCFVLNRRNYDKYSKSFFV